MVLGIRGIMDDEGQIHTWPTVAMTHVRFVQTGRAGKSTWTSETAPDLL